MVRVISIHALREEGDADYTGKSTAEVQFLSTPSARRATREDRIQREHRAISIHALREEGDRAAQRRRMERMAFLSTPSARRATVQACRAVQKAGNFYPRPPRGGRPRPHGAVRTGQRISIHALREEGDQYETLKEILTRHFYPRPPRGGRQVLSPVNGLPVRFLSTPSARRATIWHSFACFLPYDFYPRPPRGGRQAKYKEALMQRKISIHALREEGDCKNGEKHLRFCFIIKRSAQIWKSLSKNIRKNSCDLHRTA